MKISLMKNRIKELVRTYPVVTENYNLLITYYWKHVEGVSNFNEVDKCSSSESITRVFRKLVQDGEIVIPKNVRQDRLEYEKSFRENFSPVGN